MISRSKAKFIKSLQLKKFRKLENAFIVEGAKNVLELLNADYQVLILAATSDFLKEYENRIDTGSYAVYEVTEKELVALGTLKTNREALAVARMKADNSDPAGLDEMILALDDIRDPGNLGALLRVADWYGIKQIVASETSTDMYNPKTLQASMGSFTRVNVYYTDLGSFFKTHPVAPVYGAFMEGEDVSQVEFKKTGVILIGNESNGIREELRPYIHKFITIKRFGGAESLNAAAAAAVICDNWRRNHPENS